MKGEIFCASLEKSSFLPPCLNGHHNDKEIQDKSVDGLCHEFEYSILFFLVVAVIGFSFTIYVILLVTKRRNFIFYGFDILYSLLFLSAAIR